MTYVKVVLVFVAMLFSSYVLMSQTWEYNSGVTYFNGQVGIGVTTPNRALAVNGIIHSYNSQNVPGQGGLTLGDAGGHYWGFRRTATGSHLAIDAWNGSVNVEYMRVLSNNGYVGIGTSNPQFKFTVSGNTDGVHTGVVNQSSTGQANHFVLNDNNQSVALNIYGSNYISPFYRNLGVVSATNALALVTDIDVASGGSAPFSIITGGYNHTPSLYVTGGNPGNVGIGTTTPTTKLDVNGNIKATGFILPTGASAGKILTSDANGNATWQTATGSSSGWALNGSTVGAMKSIGTVDNYDLPIITNNIERMRILAGGSVAIGTGSLPASDAKLAVDGYIYSRKVKVTQTGWADYVFDRNYRLRPLSEVEQFIQQHHHLPEVPSAAEVEKNGIDLGDNQATLLKKIEELTLYVIEQKKQLDKQAQQLDQQALLINLLQKSIGQTK